MIRRIRELMAVPFARPPGRLWVLRRLAPGICAGLVYTVLLAMVIRVILRGWQWNDYTLTITILPAYVLAVAIMTLAPMVLSLNAWNSEYQRETMDSLVLTTADRAGLVYGRFWHLAWPWMRFAVWILPLYLALSLLPIMHKAKNNLLVAMVDVGGSKGFFAVLAGIQWSSIESFGVLGVCLALLRWLRDALCILPMVAVGCHVSLRFGAGRGRIVSCLLYPLAFATVLCSQDWVLGGLGLTSEMLNLNISQDVVVIVYIAVMVVAAILEIAVAWKSLRLLARNFDAYALGVRPEPRR